MQTFKNNKEHAEHIAEELWQKFDALAENGADVIELNAFIHENVDTVSPFLGYEMKQGLKEIANDFTREVRKRQNY